MHSSPKRDHQARACAPSFSALLFVISATLAITASLWSCTSDSPNAPTSDAAQSDSFAKADAALPRGDAAPPQGCRPNQTRACSCPPSPLAVGIQRCLPDGRGYAPCECLTAGATFYVSPTGSPTASGTKDAPFGSVIQARDAIRTLKQGSGLPAGGVVVWIRGGVYLLTASFTFTALDAGTKEAPITYRGFPGETVRFIGGTALPAAWLTPVTAASTVWDRVDAAARGKLVQADLKAHGITDYGTLAMRGFYAQSPAAMELFADDERAPLGRFPDVDQNDPDNTVGGPTLTLYGTLSPDASGVYSRDGTQDGQPAYKRQGLVGGKQFHLYRMTWDYQGNTNTAWFLTTNATGYPATTDPFWSGYRAEIGPLTGSQGATGTVTLTDPAGVNHGFASVAAAPSNQSFVYAGDRPARWSKAPDLWLHGFWKYAWADLHVAATSVNTATKTIQLAAEPSFGVAALQPYYAYNLLEEITQPGEWYLDRTSGVLYLWPRRDLAQTEMHLSMLQAPLFVLDQTQYLVLADMVIEMGRQHLLTITGGAHNQVVGATLRHAGNNAVLISGSGHTLSHCVIYDLGDAGVILDGGDRKSLTRGDNVVEQSAIHDFGRFSYTYTPAVAVSGVGQTVRNNRIEQAPHSAILISGNEHRIERNHIQSVCRFSSDAGAIYTGRDWGYRGNVIQHNLIHDIRTYFAGYGVHGVYLDDCVSGFTVKGNVLYRISGNAIQHGGGRDNILVNNLIARCGVGLAADSRGVEWRPSAGPNSTPGDSWNLLEKLQQVNYQEEPWASAYPTCAAIPSDWSKIIAPGATWLYPEGCVFSRNAGFENTTFINATSGTLSHYAEQKDNLQDKDPLFVDEAALNLDVRAESPVNAIPGWEPIPWREIGITGP